MLSKTKDSLMGNSPWLLPLLLVVGAGLGFFIGGMLGHHWTSGDWPLFTGMVRLVGDLFMNLLTMTMVPLVVFSMIVGVSSLGGLHKFQGIFWYTFLYYLVTTLIAVVLGLALVSAISPGLAAKTDGLTAPAAIPLTWYDALFRIALSLVPANLLRAAADGQIIGLLVFSLVFGVIVSRMGERGRELTRLLDTVNDALFFFVKSVVWLAPLGVMALVADRIGHAGGGQAVWADLSKVGWYVFTVLLGLVLHAFIILPTIMFIMTGRNPFRHFMRFSEALLTAFATASSAATLPVTLRCATENAHISRQSAGFVLPLGATVNMDGTALYEAIAVVFIAQAYGMDLGTSQLFVVALTATLASVGAAAIPQAGLVTMVMVLAAVHVPVEGIGLLLSVDWLLDRFRTVVNVWGDAVGCCVVDSRFRSGMGPT